MHPPFHAADRRFDSVHLPWEERRVPRRSLPQRLRFDVPERALPVPRVEEPRPPRRPTALRVWLGERLMALGQRLAGDGIPS